jgi:nitrogenase molybdenum-iron protein alpha/beta subunit
MEKQIFPALSDEEVYEMFMDEWERKFNLIEAMTPQQKAEELILKFMRLQEPNYNWFHSKLAKQCALIAVDNIIAANPHSNPLNTEVHSTMQYWMDVKTEINKI